MDEDSRSEPGLVGHRSDVAAALARRARRRDFGPGPFTLGVRITFAPAYVPLPRAYPFLPVVHDLARLSLAQAVTVIVGDNGAGKSTVIEALAIASGFDAQGGPLPAGRPGRAEPHERVLADALDLRTGRHRPRAGFFLRAESFYNVAGELDATDRSENTPLRQQSHGESVLALAEHRFEPDGLFILDEPESALSVGSQLAFIAAIQGAVAAGSQFILATHSPILISYPGAAVYEASARGLEPVVAEDTDPVRLTRGFLDGPERFLRHLEP